MLFQRSCSNDIITQAQPPSYSTQAWTIPSVLIYFKTPHQPAGQTFKIALWRSLVWSSGVIFSCLFCFCFLICGAVSQCRQALKAKTKANDFLITSCESASSAANCQAQPSGGSDLTLLHFQGACCTACLLLTPPCSLGVG